MIEHLWGTAFVNVNTVWSISKNVLNELRSYILCIVFVWSSLLIIRVYLVYIFYQFFRQVSFTSICVLCVFCLFWVFNSISSEVKKNNTLVSRNAGDEKNIHPVGHKFIFFNRFSTGILISSLVSFAFFDSCFFFCCFFELKNVYYDTHSTMQAGEW